jgi:polyvinyl alcohol dehydrogenase (cytochrome)
MVYALDPNQAGELVWQARVSEGSGGVQWGSAADHRNLYVAGASLPPGGVSALDLKTGAIRWRTPAPAPVCSWGVQNCVQAQPQAVTVMPGIAFAGALDGHLRAYSTINGNIVWDFDTAREFPTVNGVKASGGSLDHGGPTIVNGMVFVNSGYGRGAGQPGNVLLAFSVGGK